MNSDDKLKRASTVAHPQAHNPHQVSAWGAELNVRLLTVVRQRGGQFSRQTMARMVAHKQLVERHLLEAFGPDPNKAPLDEVLAMLAAAQRHWGGMADAPGDTPPEMPYRSDGSGRRNPAFERMVRESRERDEELR